MQCVSTALWTAQPERHSQAASALLYQVRFAQTRMLHINNPCPVPFIVPHIFVSLILSHFPSFHSPLSWDCHSAEWVSSFSVTVSLRSVGCCPNLLHSSFERWLLDRRALLTMTQNGTLKRTHLKVNSLNLTVLCFSSLFSGWLRREACLTTLRTSMWINPASQRQQPMEMLTKMHLTWVSN